LGDGLTEVVFRAAGCLASTKNQVRGLSFDFHNTERLPVDASAANNVDNGAGDADLGAQLAGIKAKKTNERGKTAVGRLVLLDAVAALEGATVALGYPSRGSGDGRSS
jgi:hypothetical protein